MVIQPALLTAVQEAVAELSETAMLPVPATAVKFAEEGVREYCGAAAACVTANESPAMAMEPDRGVVAALAATE